MKLFYHRVGQNFTRNFFHFGFGISFRNAGVQRNFEIFALANLLEARVPDFTEGSVDGFALRIENAFFEGNVDLSFHAQVELYVRWRLARLRFCLWKVYERTIHCGTGGFVRLSKEESCLSSSAMDCSSICRRSGCIAPCNWPARRLRARRRLSRRWFRFCSAAERRGRRAPRSSKASACCCSIDLLSQPRALIKLLQFPTRIAHNSAYSKLPNNLLDCFHEKHKMLLSKAKLCAWKWRRGLRGLLFQEYQIGSHETEPATVIVIGEPLYAAWHAAFTSLNCSTFERKAPRRGETRSACRELRANQRGICVPKMKGRWAKVKRRLSDTPAPRSCWP